MAGIYIHIPFCKRKCVYCDFYSTAQFDKYRAAFMDAARREMRRETEFIAGEPVGTLYLGGGTPSLYGAADIGRLIGSVKEIFDASDIAETTVEANPEDIDGQWLYGLRGAGADRLSIGAQSFDDGVLRFMKRRHDAAKASDAVRLAREAGFENISIDLIYGVPGMSLALWERTLDRALELTPEHISAYHLTFEPQTTLGRRLAAGKVREVPDGQSRVQFDLLRQKLTGAGYEHYEVSNFARPGYRSRHNSAYWTGEKYLGIGPGAHSFDGARRRWCTMKVEDYVYSEEPVYGSETLSPDDIYNELVMTSLRRAEGITTTEVTARAGGRYTAHFLTAAAAPLAAGSLRREEDRYYIHPADFLTSDSVIAALFI